MELGFIANMSHVVSVSIFKSGETYGPILYYLGSLGSHFAFKIETDSQNIENTACLYSTWCHCAKTGFLFLMFVEMYASSTPCFDSQVKVQIASEFADIT
jgi:hypothetical protein